MGRDLLRILESLKRPVRRVSITDKHRIVAMRILRRQTIRDSERGRLVGVIVSLLDEIHVQRGEIVQLNHSIDTILASESSRRRRSTTHL